MTAWRRSSSARSSDGRFSARSMRSGLSAPTARAIDQVLQTAKRPEDLGVWLGADLTAAEVHYLMAKEGAQTADDVLWRRSKLGLRLAQNERAALEQFMTATAR